MQKKHYQKQETVNFLTVAFRTDENIIYKHNGTSIMSLGLLLQRAEYSGAYLFGTIVECRGIPNGASKGFRKPFCWAWLGQYLKA